MFYHYLSVASSKPLKPIVHHIIATSEVELGEVDEARLALPVGPTDVKILELRKLHKFTNLYVRHIATAEV